MLSALFVKWLRGQTGRYGLLGVVVFVVRVRVRVPVVVVVVVVEGVVVVIEPVALLGVASVVVSFGSGADVSGVVGARLAA